MAATAMALLTQKCLSAGRTAMVPTPKAATSVAVVTVMETPALCMVSAMFLTRVLLSLSSSGMFSRHRRMTNMLSMPMPRARKGSTPWTVVYQKPKPAVSPSDIMMPKPTFWVVF